MKLKKGGGKIRRRTFQCRNLIFLVAFSQKTPKKSMGEGTKEPLGRQAFQKRTVLEGSLLEGLVSTNHSTSGCGSVAAYSLPLLLGVTPQSQPGPYHPS